MSISDDALKFVKGNKKYLIQAFCSRDKYPPSKRPFTILMAGSPGAGKTEFSKSLIPILQKSDPECAIVRIDADEVRSIIPQFTGSNSDLIQAAASLGVEKLFDYVQDHNQNCIVDGTLANILVARKNISRALKHGRKVGIFYIYQNPLIAWDFTKKREAVEGRTVPAEAFVNAFFSSKENVNLIKSEFGQQIELNVIIKNSLNGTEKTLFNVSAIDKRLGSDYTMGSLIESLTKQTI